jgi:aminopeptidase
MSDNLSPRELVSLIRSAFLPSPADRRLAVMIDLPDAVAPDNDDWALRRAIAAGWVRGLAPLVGELGLEGADLVLYRNAHTNNGDLPHHGWYHPADAPLPPTAEDVLGDPVTLDEILASHSIVLLPTEFSATAPMKVAAPRLGFRAATMPGFGPGMLPALRLDYEVIGQRVDHLRALLDQAVACDVAFLVDGAQRYDLRLDLRHRRAHASGGRFPHNGIAGNLPSGEAYIVPYEGEIRGDPSRSAGTMPVQLGGEVVLYEIVENRAVRVLSDGPTSTAEAGSLAAEPAYGNLSELGLGVLGDMGIEPIGEVLLDEKLGVHIAFGRSEHFGGQVGPGDFSSPDKVIHIDRVYVPKLQPRVVVAKAVLIMADGGELLLAEDGVIVAVQG